MKNALLSLSMLLLCSAAHAQVTMMDDVSQAYLDKLIEIGKANYPKFKYTTAKAEAAREGYNKAKCGILDFVNLSYVYYPGGYPTYEPGSNTYSSSLLNGYQLGVFVNIGSILQKPATVKQAKKEMVAAKYDKEVTDLDVVQEIRKRYYTYIQQQNILKLKAKSVSDADDMLKQVKYKFERGEITMDVYNQALLSSSTYSQEKINAESALLIAKSSLEEILGTTLESIK